MFPMFPFPSFSERNGFFVFGAFPSFVRPHSGISAGMVFLFLAHSRPLERPESGLSALGRGLPALSRHPTALSRHPGRDNHILFFVNPIRRKEHRRILQRTQHTKFRHRLLRETKVPLKTDAVSLPDIKRKESEKTVKTMCPAGIRFKKPAQAKNFHG